MALETRVPLQEPAHYPESFVRFSFSKCDMDNYCIQNLEKDELKRLYSTFGRLENITWKNVRQLQHEKGFSIEKKDSSMHSFLQPRMDGCSTFGHFRVNGSASNTRVFVGLQRDLAYILLIDRSGELQHN